jgi:hypothetical protein
MMHTARRRPGRVEEAHGLRLRRIRDVEDLEPGGLHSRLTRLIRDHQQVADEIQRVGAHPVVRQVGLHDDRRLLRIRDVHRGDVARRRLVRDPQHAALVAGELDRHPLPAIPEAVERVMSEQAHLHRRLLRDGYRAQPRSGRRRCHAVACS